MEQLPVDTTTYSLADSTPQPNERRDDERHLTLFRVGAMTVGRRRELCLIKNISVGGMKIRPYCELAEGDKLTIELKTGMSVPGTVTWLRDGNAGVTFSHSVDVVEILSQSANGPRPRMPRIEVDCPGTVRDGAHVHRVKVRDVSQGGIKVECPSALATGVDLAVTLPGLETQAGVACWWDDGVAGISFNRLLPLGKLVQWLKAMREELRVA